MADRFRILRSLAVIDLEIRADGPILVKGPDAAEPGRPDMAFVRYPTPWGPAPFLPGSSLKGVLRTGTEQLLGALGHRVCDPHDRRNGCRAEDRCPVCLLFGSVHGAGHLIVDDALPWRADDDDATRRRRVELINARTVVRNGVGIDRRTGAVSRGLLFDYEVIVDAGFHGAVRLRNPEPWHLGAVAAACELLDTGVLRIGSGGTRGLGRVRVLPRRIEVRSPDTTEVDRLWGDAPGDGAARQGIWTRRTVEGARPGWEVLERWAGRLGGDLEGARA